MFKPPTPTWRICHPVNIYVYRNGLANEKPCLVHIPMEKKKNMRTVLEAIDARMKLPVGYPIALYHMDGHRVCKTYELEMYNNYVAVTNIEKRFKCVDYGKMREPLVVIGRHSRHVNTLKMQNKRFDLFCRQKMAKKPLHELMASSGDQDGLGPGELPVGNPCGALCSKVIPRRDRPTQCCSDEIMCVEGAFLEGEEGQCGGSEGNCWEDGRRSSLDVPPGTPGITEEDCRLLEELQQRLMEGSTCSEGPSGPGGGGSSSGAGPLGVNKNLIDLMMRYKDVGSDIFKLFQDKINRRKDDQGSQVSQRWKIPGGSTISLETQKKLKEELIRLAEESCQFTFDKHGNFLFSEGCRVAPGGQMTNVGVETDKYPLQKPPQDTTLRQMEGGGEKKGGEGGNQPGGGGSSPQVGEISPPQGEVANSIVEMEEEEERSQMPAGNGGEMEGTTTPAEPQSKQRVSKMQSEITNIMGSMRRSLVMSKSNTSSNGGTFPPGMNTFPKSPPRTLSGIREENEEDDDDDVPTTVTATISTGSNKSKASSKKDEGGNLGGDVNVFSLMMDSQNPFKTGQVPPLAGKLHKDRLDKLFAENPFRKHWFHGEQTPRDGGKEVDDDPFLKNLQPPEGFGTPTDASPQPTSRTEWWPPKKPDVFLQQINELVQRHDNTKATSPPPPLPHWVENESVSTFTIGPSPRGSRARMVNVGCGQSKMEVPSKKKSSHRHHRNVCAQAGIPLMEDPPRGEDSPIRKPRCYEGGTQTRKVGSTTFEVETLPELPSEDEKPAGIYEGYQESIKSDGEISDNDGDDERKVYYRKRRESKRVRRKRKEHYLHPLNRYSPEEDNFLVGTTRKKSGFVRGDQGQQQVRFVFNNGTGQQSFPGIAPLPQKPMFVQTSSATPTTLPFLGRHSAQAPMQLAPLLITQQGTAFGGGRGGFLLATPQQHNNANLVNISSSPLIRQPGGGFIITNAAHQGPPQLQNPHAKFLPPVQSQNAPMRLIRIIPSPQQSVTSGGPTSGTALQNKLIQMMTPSALNSSQQLQFIQGAPPHHQPFSPRHQRIYK